MSLAVSAVLSAVNALVRLLLDPVCPSCRAPLERPLSGLICDTCWAGIPGVASPCCIRCGDTLRGWRAAESECARCRRTRPSFTLARSAGRHDGSLRQMIHAFKYERHRLLAEPLARLMRENGREVLDGADAVVPVPLHPIRALQRGFNQADDLARHLGLPVWRVLRRRTHGPPQAGLPAARRHANLREAYVLSGAWSLGAGLRGRRLQDAAVVVIDDVMTTGATIEACSRALLSAGVRSVRALTAARASTGPPHAPHAPHPRATPPR
jgi:ComF family protein